MASRQPDTFLNPESRPVPIPARTLTSNSVFWTLTSKVLKKDKRPAAKA